MKSEAKVEVATTLHVSGKKWVEIYRNFALAEAGDKQKIEIVEQKVRDHCELFTSKNFNRYLSSKENSEI